MFDLPEQTLAVHYPWQGAQWSHCVELQRAGRLPHALLLAGPEGVGKRRFALALAQSLMCEQSGPQGPCGECRQCHFNLAATHPDLKLLTFEEKAKQIKVDQVRGLIDFFSQTAQQGGYKVTLIAPAEAMNINAAGAKQLNE